MARFAPSSWVQRTSSNLSGGNLRFGHQSHFSDDAIMVVSDIGFAGIGLQQWAVSDMSVSTNRMSSWTRLDVNSAFPQTVQALQSIQLANGATRYLRLRYQFGRSFFIANNEIPAGFIAIDISDFGPANWTEVQKLYTWSHKPDTGSGGQASATINAGFFTFPGSGPGGADADWLLIAASVGSGQGSVLNVFRWWRSDDYGVTWNDIRNASSGPFTAYPTEGIVLGGAGGGHRLVASIGGNLMYSNDFGVNWTGTTGVIFGPKTGITEQAGQTWAVFIPGTQTSPASTAISCDNMASVVGGQGSLAGLNVNWSVLKLGPSEILALISGGVGVGQVIYYSDNGGEIVNSQGADARMPASQAGMTHNGLFKDGAPFFMGVNQTSFISNDRASGNFSTRTTCPLAFAGLKKAGIPENCAHPILTRCD